MGNEVSFEYDLDRRMDLIDFGPDAEGQPNQVDFEYDATTGQLSTITSPTGTISVGYELGHMTSLSAPSPNGAIVTSIDYDGFLPTALSWAGPVAGEVNWTYNDRFLIETETIGALPETAVTYSYDDDGLVTQAGDLSMERDVASGRVLSKTIGNIRESFQYNEFAELSRQTVDLMESDGSSVKETIYDVIYDDDGTNGDRDALGRITKKTEWIVSGDTPGSEPRELDARTYDYGYNADGRPWLESVAVDGSVVSSYGYDDNGNRTSVDLSWSQLGYDSSFDVSLTEADTEYDSADKLLTYGTMSYEWNAFGQLKSMTDSATGETTGYDYDLFGNLLSVALPDGRSIEYDVDADGRRMARRELDTEGNEISFRGWIYRDLLRPIAEVDASGNLISRYVYSSKYSNHPSHLVIPATGGEAEHIYRLVSDNRGSLVTVVDTESGEIVERIEYDSFGRMLSPSSDRIVPFGFAGGLYDEDTKLIRFGVRDLIPELGRWTARDPILFLARDANLYIYVGNDPINYVDIDGYCPFNKRKIAQWLNGAGSLLVVGGGLAGAYGAYTINPHLMVGGAIAVAIGAGLKGLGSLVSNSATADKGKKIGDDMKSIGDKRRQKISDYDDMMGNEDSQAGPPDTWPEYYETLGENEIQSGPSADSENDGSE